MSDSKSILVVRPASLDDAMRAAMVEAGVLIVEAAEPDDVRLLTAEPLPLSGNDMVYAALCAIAGSNYSTCYQFVEKMRVMMKAARDEAKAAKQPAIKQPVRGPGGRFVKA